MRLLAVLLAPALLATAFAGCFHAASPPPAASVEHGCPKVEGRTAGGVLWTLATSLGTLVAELCLEQAPVTVNHILNVTRQGKYDGATFYRVVGPSETSEKGFVIQGGLQAGASTIAKVVDEFHPALRHDRRGVLSIAHAGPGTGSSEFFVTLDATPHLDDRHAVFGYVVEGMSTLDAIAVVKTEASAANPSEKSKPVTAITISKATARAHPDAAAVHGAVSAYAPMPTRLMAPSDGVNWAVVVRNLGTYRDNVTLTVTGPAGWSFSVEPGRATQPIPAGKGAIFLASALAPAGTANGSYNLTATATSGRNASAVATAQLVAQVGELGASVGDGQRVLAHYVGMLPDGRVFDTSVEGVASNASLFKMGTVFTYRGAGVYAPFNFTIGSGVIAGFTNLAKQTQIGETRAMRIEPKDAYPTGDLYRFALVGKPLVFELQVLKVCATATKTDPC